MLEDSAGIRRVVLACGYVDLRKGIDGLSMIIGDRYHQNPFEKEPSSSSAADGLTGSKAFSGWVTVSSSFTKGWKPVPCHGQEPVKKPQTLPRSSSGIL